MILEKISYKDLNAKQQEIYNFQKIAAVLADYGYNCIKLADDWQGADFLAYHVDGQNTIRVQLKGRIMIDKKYEGKEIHMAFPHDSSWYLVDHDFLMKVIKENTNWMNTKSWIKNGRYGAKRPSKLVLSKIQNFKLN